MMHRVAALARTLFGLFVDDGGLAVAVLLWVAVVRFVPIGAGWRGGILFAGLGCALAWSCRRAIRRHCAADETRRSRV